MFSVITWSQVPLHSQRGVWLYGSLMFWLLVPLLYVVTAQPGAGRDYLLTLRDYDFVGEDKRLAGLLAGRMAMLDRPIDLSDIDTRSELEQTLNYSGYRNFEAKPDNIEINVRGYPKVNVSMDYGELWNADIEVNTSSSQPYRRLQPGQAGGNLTASRRAPTYYDPSYWEYNKKILQLMRQSVYAAQNRLIDIEPIIQKYQSDARFRIAYLFNRLQEWKRDMRTIYHAMVKLRVYANRMRVKEQLIYYQHILRKNIDITYSVEFLIHLHGAYMAKLELVSPRINRQNFLSQASKKDAGAPPGRPKN